MQDELFKKIVTVFKIFYSFKASYPVGAFYRHRKCEQVNIVDKVKIVASNL